MNRMYKITSERWARDEVVASFKEIQQQAEIFTADRQASGDIDTRGPVTVRIEAGNIIDDTGEVIAEQI
jgi:hypothetical protein